MREILSPRIGICRSLLEMGRKENHAGRPPPPVSTRGTALFSKTLRHPQPATTPTYKKTRDLLMALE